MSDPAVEAAKRAVPIPPPNWMLDDKIIDSLSDYGIAAAREALKPIREKIRELQTDIPTDDPKFGEGVDYAIAELAPLIYPTEELER